jgi:methyl-accepting chemotaxis protein
MKLKIAHKITGGYLLLLLLLIGLGFYVYTASNTTSHHLQQIKILDQRLDLEQDIQAEIYAAVSGIRGYIAYGQDEFEQSYITHMEKTIDLQKQVLAISAADNKHVIENLTSITAEYHRTVTEDLLPAIEQRFNAQNEAEEDILQAQVDTIVNNQAMLVNQLETAIADIVKENADIRDQYMVDVIDNAIAVKKRALIFPVLAVAVGGILSFVLSSMVRKPIMQMIAGANKYAAGDFSQQIHINSSDEIGDLARTFNDMSRKLSILITDVTNNARLLASHSEELAASGEEVNATVEEVASAANEVSATAAAGFHNAEMAVVESQRVSEVAQTGNETVNKTVNKINAIASVTVEVEKSIKNLNQLSNQIGEITNVITDIAEQTNLLALNAAIEAARAGEQGKGFAVVADEVRKLAEQSANATKDIANLINQVQVGVELANSTMQQGAKEVEEGVQLASAAGQAIMDIMTSINGAINMMEDIKEGAERSSQGMEQVATGNEQITSTTQQISAEAQELAQIANQMHESVNQFKVADV